MPKIKAPYLILIGILAAACQFGMSKMESRVSTGSLDEIVIQDMGISKNEQSIEMDNSDPYGLKFELR